MFPTTIIFFPLINRYFGQNCNQICKCKNFARCRKNDGYCICNAGWMGAHCEDVCPEGLLNSFIFRPIIFDFFFQFYIPIFIRFPWATLYGILFMSITTICMPCSSWLYMSCRFHWNRLFNTKGKIRRLPQW